MEANDDTVRRDPAREDEMVAEITRRYSTVREKYGQYGRLPKGTLDSIINAVRKDMGMEDNDLSNYKIYHRVTFRFYGNGKSKKQVKCDDGGGGGASDANQEEPPAKKRTKKDDAVGTAAAVAPTDPFSSFTKHRWRSAGILAATSDPSRDDDLDLLTVSQLEGEIVRLENRLERARTRLQHVRSPAFRSSKERVRRRCKIEGCNTIAVRGGVCKKHGKIKSICKVEGCERWVQQGGVCYTHGAKYTLCEVEGCTNKRQSGRVCCRHGATKKQKRNAVQEHDQQHEEQSDPEINEYEVEGTDGSLYQYG